MEALLLRARGRPRVGVRGTHEGKFRNAEIHFRLKCNVRATTAFVNAWLKGLGFSLSVAASENGSANGQLMEIDACRSVCDVRSRFVIDLCGPEGWRGRAPGGIHPHVSALADNGEPTTPTATPNTGADHG
ncbi:hypothetical protein [Streptomyces sp. GS7]|uniref:hypothetical protein n=1 Tax=Streptomyces sp. GS7 TaxID=2692234 RepID=UPI0013173FFB|nr:hypothetical protein [Streptomyces sp. GS7]QHC23818.1 hypothetical protein GR130_23115 [Streptomyces sp. GS7]